MANPAAQQDPLALVKIDDATVVALVNRIKEQIVRSNKKDTTSLYLYEAMMTIIKLHATLAEKTQGLESVFDMFAIGSEARSLGVLTANIDNLIRRAACLSQIEQDFFTTMVKTDEGEMEDCPLNWGSEPEEYSQQFGTALESRKESSRIILLN